MNTAVHQEIKNSNVAATGATAITNKHSEFWETLEFNRFGFVPFILVVVACMGGIAGAFAIQESPIKLAIVVLATGMSEAAILGVLPMRTIVMVSIISVLVSLITIIV